MREDLKFAKRLAGKCARGKNSSDFSISTISMKFAK